jgi:hypothetical protein
MASSRESPKKSSARADQWRANRSPRRRRVAAIKTSSSAQARRADAEYHDGRLYSQSA